MLGIEMDVFAVGNNKLAVVLAVRQRCMVAPLPLPPGPSVSPDGAHRLARTSSMSSRCGERKHTVVVALQWRDLDD